MSPDNDVPAYDVIVLGAGAPGESGPSLVTICDRRSRRSGVALIPWPQRARDLLPERSAPLVTENHLIDGGALRHRPPAHRVAEGNAANVDPPIVRGYPQHRSGFLRPEGA